MTRLGDVVLIDRTSVDPIKIRAGETYLGLENIEIGGRILGSRSVSEGELLSSKFLFDERHILFGKLRPNLAKVARPTFSGICSTDILPLLPSASVDRDYLAHFLLLPSTTDWAASRTSGVNLPRLNPSVLQGLEIPLPPLPEQRRIASILDQVGALRTQRRSALAHLDRLDAALLDRLIATSPTRLRPLGQVLAAIDSGVSPVCQPRPAEPGEWGILKLGAISTGEFVATGNSKALTAGQKFDRNHEVRPGDILFSRKNTLELVGASAYVESTPPGMLLPDLIFRLVPNVHAGVRPVFLQRILAQETTRGRLRKLAGGSAASMSNISKARLLEFEVPLPSAEVQRDFQVVARSVSKIRQASRRHLALLDELFASLQHRAFNGEL